MHCLLNLLNYSRPQNSGLAQIRNECNQWTGEVIDVHERSGKCIKSAETIKRKEYKSFVRASKPTLAPYGPLWPLLGEITLKLSNSKTFKLSNFQGWLHMVHPGPVCGEISCRRPSLCKVQVGWNLGLQVLLL